MTFTDLLYRNRIAYRRSQTSKDEIQFNCPFCLERRGVSDHGFSFHLNIKNGAGHCWHQSCDWKSRKALPVVIRKLRGEGIALDDIPEEAAAATPVKLPEDFELLTGKLDDLELQAQQYLLHRGITRAQIKKRHLGISLSGRYAYRIVFPITDPDGVVLYGLTARDFTGRQEPKYLTNKGPKYLFNFDPDATCCILSEGVFKALRIEQVTTDCSAALLGHALTPQQLEQIQTSKCEHIILWPDPDGVGRKGVAHIAELLCEEWGKPVSIVWPVTKPADEISLKNLSTALDLIQPFNWATAQFLLQR